jgi:hypothetical protein
MNWAARLVRLVGYYSSATALAAQKVCFCFHVWERQIACGLAVSASRPFIVGWARLLPLLAGCGWLPAGWCVPGRPGRPAACCSQLPLVVAACAAALLRAVTLGVRLERDERRPVGGVRRGCLQTVARACPPGCPGAHLGLLGCAAETRALCSGGGLRSASASRRVETDTSSASLPPCP